MYSVCISLPYAYIYDLTILLTAVAVVVFLNITYLVQCST